MVNGISALDSRGALRLEDVEHPRKDGTMIPQYECSNSINSISGWNALARECNVSAFEKTNGRAPRDDKEANNRVLSLLGQPTEVIV